MFLKLIGLFVTGISVINSFSTPRSLRAREGAGENKIKKDPKEIRQPADREHQRSLPGPRATPPPRPKTAEVTNNGGSTRGRGRSARRVALYTVLNQYAEAMRTRLEAERLEELRVETERLKSWPIARLETEGILISDLHAEVEEELFYISYYIKTGSDRVGFSSSSCLSIICAIT